MDALVYRVSFRNKRAPDSLSLDGAVRQLARVAGLPFDVLATEQDDRLCGPPQVKGVWYVSDGWSLIASIHAVDLGFSWHSHCT